MAKSNDAMFRSLVENKQKERWELPITTDGYKLIYKDTKMTLREKIEVMKAFERGEKIEVEHCNMGNWGTASEPAWDWYKYNYRIKPKPKQVVVIEKWLCQHDAVYIIASSSDIKKYVPKYWKPIKLLDTYVVEL